MPIIEIMAQAASAASHPSDPLAELLWQAGYAICHQLPSRSLLMAGYQLPVCARDAGTMLGFGAVLLLFLAGRRHRRSGLPDAAVLAACLAGFALFAFDALSSYLGLRETTNELRLISGLGMGLALGVLLCTALARFVGGDETRRCFDWSDLLLLLPLMALAYLGAGSDLGLAGWYLLSFAIIAMMFCLLMVAMQTIVRALLWERRRWSEPRIFVLSALLAFGLLALLWAFHRVTEGIVPSS